MNIKTYKGHWLRNKPIAFCFVDNTHTCTSDWTKELVKNQADFTITNVTSKGYDVLQGQDEDALLEQASHTYDYAVVFSVGTEFVNGTSFFDEVEQLTKTDFFIAGHVLDRKDAYYELHHQCYVVNLSYYKKLNLPTVGKQELGSLHIELMPARSKENYHDDYTPTWVTPGKNITEEYQHKCHGWNIIREALEHDLAVVPFTESIRNSKRHFYPENQTEFLKHSAWLYARHNYCSTEFVHTSNTDWSNTKLNDIRQVFTPASGTWWVDHISTIVPVKVVMYDYNQKALDYWKNAAPKISNVSYEFVKLDLLTDALDFSMFDPALATLVNLSNIFAYEATAPFYSLEYRLAQENKAIHTIKKFLPNAFINFSARASSGFAIVELFGNDLQGINIKNLTKPTWHNNDWI